MGTNRTAQLNADRKMTLAIPRLLGHIGTMTLDGKPYVTADLVNLFQRRIDTADAAASAYGKWLDAVKADHDELARSAIAVRALKDTLRGMYATHTEMLGEFGLAPRKVGKRTVETKLQAVVQSKETRKVRKTMGKVQRKAVKGNVEVKMMVTPVAGSGQRR